MKKKSKCPFLSHYLCYSYETWPVGSMQQDLSKHICEDDLDPKVKVRGDMKNQEKIKMYLVLATIHTIITNVGQEVVWDEMFRNISIQQ